MTDAREPGDFAVCPIAGPGGFAIGTAEGLAAVVAKQLTFPGFTRWQHAKVYVGGGKILQAEPGGSVIITQPVQPGDYWSTGIIALPAHARTAAEEIAPRWTGVGYSALDYAALLGHHAHLPDVAVWPGQHGRVSLQQFIAAGGHQICSQLVDSFLLACGVHLFADGRWAGFVMPYDLGRVIAAGKIPYTGR